MLDAPAAWLDERPSLRAAWLAWRNAVRRWPLAAAGLAAALITLVALGRWAPVAHLLAGVSGAPFIVGVITAALFAMGMRRRGQRLAGERHRDWLAALPSDVSLVARTACAPLLIGAGLVLVTVAAELVAGLPARDFAALALALTAGCVAAFIITVLSMAGDARRARRTDEESLHAAPPSRYARVRRPRRRWATNASLLPLGYWPVAYAKFLNRPKVKARRVVPLLLAVPMDTAAPVVLAAAALWFITLHLFSLLTGTVRVGFAATWWLAPTPVRAVRFAAAVSHRALAAQIAAGALLLGMVYAMSGYAAWHAALVRIAIVMGAAWIVSLGACILALRTREVARSGLHRWIR